MADGEGLTPNMATLVTTDALSDEVRVSYVLRKKLLGALVRGAVAFSTCTMRLGAISVLL